jgi:hypothetical protein
LSTEIIWKEIPGHVDYMISMSGQVWSKKTNKILSLKIQKNRTPTYVIAALSENGKRQFFYVHRLVLLTFEGPMPSNCDEVLHIDDNPLNNDLTNLKYGTHQDNVDDCVNKGRHSFQIHPHTALSLQKNSNSQKRAVIAVANDGSVKAFDSLSEASKELKMTVGALCNAIKDQRKTRSGFRLSYQ